MKYTIIHFLWLASLISVCFCRGKKSDKLIIRSYIGSDCINVQESDISVHNCTWKSKNSSRIHSVVAQELFSIHPYGNDENPVDPNSSDESKQGSNYVMIRMKSSSCLIALDDNFSIGKCGSRRSKFLVQEKPKAAPTRVFTIESFKEKCLTMNGNRILNRPCARSVKEHNSENPSITTNPYQLWSFCNILGQCNRSPFHSSEIDTNPSLATITNPPISTAVTESAKSSSTSDPNVAEPTIEIIIDATTLSPVQSNTGTSLALTLWTIPFVGGLLCLNRAFM